MSIKLNNFTEAYLVAALWSSNDDDGEPLDNNYSLSNIDVRTLTNVAIECEKFQLDNFPLLEQAYKKPGYTDEQAGHDFWLTRNGHGTGFWDRDLGDVGDLLTKKCKEQGSSDCYVGDDGQIYLTYNTPQKKNKIKPWKVKLNQ